MAGSMKKYHNPKLEKTIRALLHAKGISIEIEGAYYAKSEEAQEDLFGYLDGCGYISHAIESMYTCGYDQICVVPDMYGEYGSEMCIVLCQVKLTKGTKAKIRNTLRQYWITQRGATKVEVFFKQGIL